MEQWLINQCNAYTYSGHSGTFVDAYKSLFNKRFSESDCSEPLIEDSSSSDHKSLGRKCKILTRQSSAKVNRTDSNNDATVSREESGLLKTLSFKTIKRKSAKKSAEPVLSPVLRTYNQSLFTDNPSWL